VNINLYLKPKIVGITVLAVVLIAILLSVFFKLPVLYVEFHGAVVDYSAEYPKESFMNTQNPYDGLEKVNLNSQTGKISGSKISQRMKLSALISAEAASIAQRLPAKGQDENKTPLSEGELYIIYNCKRGNGCGNSEDFEPFSSYIMRNLIRQVERVGGLRAIKDSRSEMTRFNHWINRTRYYDGVLFPEYKMQTVEIALLTPDFIFSVGTSKPELKINGEKTEMNKTGYLSFVEHNLSTGIHEITLEDNKKEIRFHRNIPEIHYSNYNSEGRIILEKHEDQSLKFEKILISSNDKRKSVKIDFERNKSWTENHPLNPDNRMEIPFNDSTENTTVILTHSMLNYTKKLGPDHKDSIDTRRHILGLKEREMDTFQRLLTITGKKAPDY